MEENRKKAEEQGLQEYMKDKEQIDAIMRKVAEEDRKEQEEKEKTRCDVKNAADAMIERQKHFGNRA